MVIGHVTWWPLTLAEQTNVMLDIKPATGHRVLMQSYPGGIESGTDWYQNDAGVVLTETTIEQSPFNVKARPSRIARARRFSTATTSTKWSRLSSTKNNGLYTNEWLIGDARTNEIAMLELGTYKTRLYRSSKNDWFGGTEGFYWGNNNAKDLSVRLEYQPDPHGAPEYMPYVPQASRCEMAADVPRVQRQDRRAVRVPRVSHGAAGELDHHGCESGHGRNGVAHDGLGAFRQTQSARVGAVAVGEREAYAGNDGVYRFRLPHDRGAGAALASAWRPRSGTRRGSRQESGESFSADRLWKGWVLPASDADIWFASGSAAYYRRSAVDTISARAIARALGAVSIRQRRAGRIPIEHFAAGDT